jgi:hypothetical protein
MNEDDYLKALREGQRDLVGLRSNKRKEERERLTALAFLRLLGIQPKWSELLPYENKDRAVDVGFRRIRFQVRELFPISQKPQQEARAKLRRFEGATGFDDVREPYRPPKSISSAQTARVVERALREKAAHYGQSVCASLDALVYINVDRVLRESDDRMITEGLKRQGWRSVSAIIGASGIVLFTTEHAEAILRINEGKIKCEWPNLLTLWEHA